MRPNPRLRLCNSVLRTYIDVMHASINQKDIIFKGSAALAGQQDEEMPGTPGSNAGSEVGSQASFLLQPSAASPAAFCCCFCCSLPW